MRQVQAAAAAKCIVVAASRWEESEGKDITASAASLSVRPEVDLVVQTFANAMTAMQHGKLQWLRAWAWADEGLDTDDSKHGPHRVPF